MSINWIGIFGREPTKEETDRSSDQKPEATKTDPDEEATPKKNLAPGKASDFEIPSLKNFWIFKDFTKDSQATH